MCQSPPPPPQLGEPTMHIVDCFRKTSHYLLPKSLIKIIITRNLCGIKFLCFTIHTMQPANFAYLLINSLNLGRFYFSFAISNLLLPYLKGTGTRDQNRSELVLLSDIGQQFLNCPFNILLMFKILMQGTQIVFEFHSSFQKMRENFSPLLKSVYIYS